MNKASPRKPFKPRSQKPHDCVKSLRARLLAWHFRLRRPRDSRSTFRLALISVCLCTLVLVARRFVFPVLFSSHRELTVSDAPASEAFSPSSRDRRYDPAWAVLRDDGRVAAEKLRVEIAYFVQVGSDAVPLLPRLFARIHRPNNVYVLHIDAKVDPAQRAEVAHLIHGSEVYQRNVHIMHSEMVTYKAISMVTNTLSAMTLALEKHPTWDYFINLSGADYPLVSPQDQALLLARPRAPNGRLNFVSFFPRKEWVPYSFRIRNLHWDPAATGYQSNTSRLVLMRGSKTNLLEPHRAFTFTKAEAWMILSRPFVQFVVRSAFAKRMLLSHLHVLSVPEHYFADILYNHPFWQKTVVPDAFRKVVWYLRNRRSGQHPYILDKGSTIYSFWDYIAETKSLFARKFSVRDSLLMDRIDAEMSGSALNYTDARYRTFRKARQVFLKRIIDHFDELTKKTLSAQGYTWPKTAYPQLEQS